MLLLLSSDHFSLPFLDICCFGTGWLACCSLTLLLLLVVLRLVSVAVLWLLCLTLALLLSCRPLAVLFCLPLAVLLCLPFAVLFSVLFIISPLLDVERCSASASSLRCSSRCPRTRVALFRSSRHWLFGRGSVSDFHHLLLGCGFFSFSTGFLVVALSLLLSRDTCGT